MHVSRFTEPCAITTVHFRIFSSCRKETWYFQLSPLSLPFPCRDPKQPRVSFLCLLISVLDVSHGRNHTVCGLSCLVASSEGHVLGARPAVAHVRAPSLPRAVQRVPCRWTTRCSWVRVLGDCYRRCSGHACGDRRVAVFSSRPRSDRGRDTSVVLIQIRTFITLVKEKESVGPKFESGSQAAGLVGSSGTCGPVRRAPWLTWK